jgi:plastocyanin/heme-degrading monooxygenase HmoA
MEYVQQVQATIPAEKLGDARALFDALEAHRSQARRQRGFISLTVTRSTEEGGDTLVSAESRWKDANALTDYAVSEPNAASIIAEHQDLIVPDSIRTRRMEALDSAAPSGSTVIYERFGLALGVPVAIGLFGLAFIYMLSRLLLQVQGNGAVVIAAVISMIILLGAWYFASNPRLPVWQMAAVGVAGVAFLIGGTVYAQVAEDKHEEVVAPTETPDDGGPEPGVNVLLMEDNQFIGPGGEENPTLTFPAGSVTLTLPNEGAALHNMHIATGGSFASAFCTAGGTDPCSDPARIAGGADGSITFDLPVGQYTYRCDFHTADMEGQIVIQ